MLVADHPRKVSPGIECSTGTELSSWNLVLVSKLGGGSSSFLVNGTELANWNLAFKIQARCPSACEIKSNQGKRMTDLGPLHVEHFFIYMDAPSW